MNTLLWMLQLLLGVLFVAHGAALIAWAPPLRERLGKTYSKSFMQVIGLCEILGGLGLILPWWLGIAPVLTPLAAAGLVLILAGAVLTHWRGGETPQMVVTGTLAVLLLFITFARWGSVLDLLVGA